MRKYITFITILLAISCSKEKEQETNEPIDNQIVFSARCEQPTNTKTILQSDGSVFWEPGDRIKVYSGTTEGVFTSSINSASSNSTFAGDFESEEDIENSFWAVYPASRSVSHTGSSLRVTIPSIQTALIGSFDRTACISVAKSDNTSLQFYNVCGGIKFTITHEGVRSVTIRGNNEEKISGIVDVDFDGNGKPVVSNIVKGTTSVTINSPLPTGFEVGKTYCAMMIPLSFEKGLSICFDAAGEEKSRRWTDRTVTIKRSVFGVINNMDDNVKYSVPGDAVDLGLPSGVLWATCNVGATKPEEFGGHYAWGEIETKSEYSWENYKYWLTSNAQYTKTSNYLFSKYCGTKEFDGGIVIYDPHYDGVLEPIDDVATVELGGYWRMPTYAEQEELRDENNCTWMLTSVNGVYGYSVTSKINGNSIFLPTAGSYTGDHINANSGLYWSSSKKRRNISSSNILACAISFYNNTGLSNSAVSIYRGASVRPVWQLPTSSVEFEEDEVLIAYGKPLKLNVTVYPTSANQTVEWLSNDTSIVTVDNDGTLTAQTKYGTTTVTVTTSDGQHKATCTVYVNGVDLALPTGTIWADRNIGATSEEQQGDRFAWGETETKTNFSWDNYKFLISRHKTLDKEYVFSKYVPNTYTVQFNSETINHVLGNVDELSVLEPEDDAAHVNWGGEWRMPTWEELSELMDTNNCTWTVTTSNDVQGYSVTSVRNGCSIFIANMIWCSTVSGNPKAAKILSLKNGTAFEYGKMNNVDRYCGLAIRPVR